MTDEEAIKLLQDVKSRVECIDTYIDEEEGEALDLAIKALEARPTGKWELYQYQESRKKDWCCTACATIVNKPLEKKYKYCPYCGARMEE